MELLLPVSVGLGLVVSLLFSELFGLAAGGMVVPGYLALSLDRPLSVLLTLSVAVVTFACVRALSRVAIVYGRRRTAITILIGYVLAMCARVALSQEAPSEADMVIGFIIPGLIALWMLRQGVVETIASIITVSVMVRLALIVILGREMVGWA